MSFDTPNPGIRNGTWEKALYTLLVAMAIVGADMRGAEHDG